VGTKVITPGPLLPLSGLMPTTNHPLSLGSCMYGTWGVGCGG
jgi:hypothetical protein